MTTSNISFYQLFSDKLQFFLAAILLSLSLYSQSKPLNVGDTIPAHVLAFLTTKQQPITINLKPQTKNTFIILDFFATWCASCIRELPRLDSLQKQFGHRLQVILVGYEPQHKLNAFRKRNKTFANCSLPVIAADTLLHSYFPHTLLPHQVWINSKGIVSAITFSRHATQQNIEAWLAGASLRLPVKNDLLGFDPSLPLLQNDNGGTEQSVIFRSLFMAHLPGIFSGAGRVYNKDSSAVRMYHLNRHILSLFAAAYNKPLTSHLLLQVKDSSRFFRKEQSQDEWSAANTHCYELTLPASVSASHMQSIMQADLDRYLGFKSSLEKRIISCYTLTRIEGSVVVPAALTGAGIPVSKWIKLLNHQLPGRPLRPIVVDESGYAGNIDIPVPAGIYDINELNKQLSKYGLVFLPAMRQLEVMVITDGDNK